MGQNEEGFSAVIDSYIVTANERETASARIRRIICAGHVLINLVL